MNDDKMIEQAAAIAFSRLQAPEVPAWVGGRHPQQAQKNEKMTNTGRASWEYTMKLQDEADTAKGIAIVLGATLVGALMIAYTLAKYAGLS